MVTGLHLDTWYRDHRYCGRCATPLTHKDDERALVCPECGHIIYPDIAIAVIVGIRDGERMILSRYAHGNYRNYALIATKSSGKLKRNFIIKTKFLYNP